MGAPRFTCRDVAHVHFQHREGHGLDGVVQRHAVLRQARRVDERALHAVDVRVQLVDQRAFVVGLEGLDLHAQFAGQCHQLLVDLGQRGGAIDVRLAAAEQVEVGSVQNQQLRHGGVGVWSCAAWVPHPSSLERLSIVGNTERIAIPSSA
jgi:hypothetical protein